MPTAKSPNVGYVRDEVIKELPKWELVDDVVEGDIAVKAKKEVYLPKPETHSDDTINNKIYTKYIQRAVLYPVATRTLTDLVGQVFSKPVEIDVPASLGMLVDDINGAGLSLEQHAKCSLSEAIKKGRGGLLSDYPRVDPGAVVTREDVLTGRIRPRVIYYHPENIINWRSETINGETILSKLVLTEMKVVDDDGFELKKEPRWRVYELSSESGGVTVTLWKRRGNANNDESGDYEIDEKTTSVLDVNSQPLREIPFSVIGSENNDINVDDSPLYPLSQLNIAHYRNSADYEQNLFICGQGTPVFSGLDDDWAKSHINGKVTLGSSTAIPLPVGASAQILQATENSMPIEGMRHKEEQMKAIGAKLIEPNTVQRTATEAEIEETSEASVLSSIARNVSAAYQKALYYCSLFVGEVSEDEIVVELNNEFQVMGLNATERQEVMGAWMSGLLSWEEAREVYRRKNIATMPDEEARVSIENGNITLGVGDDAEQ